MDAKWIGLAFGLLLAAAWAGRETHAPLEPQPRAQRVEPSVEEREAIVGLSPAEAQAFRSATLTAIADVDRAWAVREESWAAVSSSAASDPELLERLEEEIQSRYEAEKARALQPLAVHLGDRLEEWFDALR